MGGEKAVSHEEGDLTPGEKGPEDQTSPIWLQLHPFGDRTRENFSNLLRRFDRASRCAAFRGYADAGDGRELNGSPWRGFYRIL